MVDDALADIEALLHSRAGLRLDQHLRTRAHRCIRDCARAHGVTDLTRFHEELVGNPELFQDLLDRITVQETGFFREPIHFEAICEHVAAQRGRDTVIWSAGCANGQEPYSLAMALGDAGLTGWRIVATDVSRSAVARARRGRYSTREIRGLDASRRRRYLIPAGDEWDVRPEIRRQVVVAHQNLVSDSAPVPDGACSLVVCRNVFIYFSAEQLRAVLATFAKALGPEGRLVTASAEALWLATDLFHLVRVGPILAYAPVHRAPVKSAPPRSPDAPVAAPGTSRAAPDRRSPATQLPGVSDLLSAGEAHLAAGQVAAAVENFRRAIYLQPDHAIAHFYLGLAHEEDGDETAAARAFTSGLRALEKTPAAGVERMLEGYTVEDLTRVLAFKLGRE